jgi:hypothetical protein
LDAQPFTCFICESVEWTLVKCIMVESKPFRANIILFVTIQHRPAQEKIISKYTKLILQNNNVIATLIIII